MAYSKLRRNGDLYKWLMSDKCWPENFHETRRLTVCLRNDRKPFIFSVKRGVKSILD